MHCFFLFCFAFHNLSLKFFWYWRYQGAQKKTMMMRKSSRKKQSTGKMNQICLFSNMIPKNSYLWYQLLRIILSLSLSLSLSLPLRYKKNSEHTHFWLQKWFKWNFTPSKKFLFAVPGRSSVFFFVFKSWGVFWIFFFKSIFFGFIVDN